MWLFKRRFLHRLHLVFGYPTIRSGSTLLESLHDVSWCILDQLLQMCYFIGRQYGNWEHQLDQHWSLIRALHTMRCYLLIARAAKFAHHGTMLRRLDVRTTADDLLKCLRKRRDGIIYLSGSPTLDMIHQSYIANPNTLCRIHIHSIWVPIVQH